MPLLGRHKSPSGGSSSSNNTNSPSTTTTTTTNASQQRRPAQVCESPLFGIRRQLPLGDTGAQAATSSGRHAQTAGAAAPDTEPLSSVPQQITRQQINYAFSIMDTNKDGMIDLRDLSQMLANLGVPIDEAILSHIMSSVSKRGDHRISEAEFLDWISLFIQVSDSQPAAAGARGQQQSRASRRRPQTAAGGASAAAPTSSTRSRVLRSSTAASSLVAQPASELPRTRRGSGSGLALMRSLSASPAAGAHTAAASPDLRAEVASTSGPAAQAASEPPGADLEARNDLRAAFGVFDLDGDGYITIDEVRAGLKLLGESWSPSELQHVFSKCSSSSSAAASGAGPATARGSRSSGRDLSGQRISIDDFVQLLL